MSEEEKKDQAPAETETAEGAAEPQKENGAEGTEAPADAQKEQAEPETRQAPEEPSDGEASDAPAEPELQPAYRSKIVGAEDLRPGQTVRVHEKIIDVSPKGEERERIQVFEGMVLGLRGGGVSRTMTVRKVTKGFGVEKIYPVNSPLVDKIEVIKVAKVRRAKLGYLKNEKRRFKRKLKETMVDIGQNAKKKKKRK